MEVRPPMMNANVVYGKLTEDGSAVKYKRKENTIIKPNRKVYSCLRKVIAPYLIILS
jgi:hypothetical protein